MTIGIVINNILRDNISQIKYLYEHYDLGELPSEDIVIDPYDLTKYFPITNRDEEVIDFDPNVSEDDFDYDDTEKTMVENDETIYDIIYNDAAFEVFSRAPETVPGIIKKFSKMNEDNDDVNFVAINIESPLSKNATLMFLGTKHFNMDAVIFPNSYESVWDYCDLLITDHPDILEHKPENKQCIKLNCESNSQYQTEYSVDNIIDIFDLEIIKRFIKEEE